MGTGIHCTASPWALTHSESPEADDNYHDGSKDHHDNQKEEGGHSQNEMLSRKALYASIIEVGLEGWTIDSHVWWLSCPDTFLRRLCFYGTAYCNIPV